MEQTILMLAVLGAQLATNPNGQSQEAFRQAGRAYYEQCGAEHNVNEYVNRNTTPELRAAVGNVAIVTKTVFDQRITFRWEFP